MEKDKKSLAYKIQKNPFLIGFAIILAGIVLITMLTLISSLRKKTAQMKEVSSEEAASSSLAASEKQSEANVSEKGANANTVVLAGLRKVYAGIADAKGTYDDESAVVTVKFKDKTALLDAHFAPSIYGIKVTPVFWFYTGSGAALKCPAKLQLSEDGVSVSYIFTGLEDLKNAAALTDHLTLTYQNALSSLPFNLYLEYNSPDGAEVGRTLVSTYSKNVEALPKLKDLSLANKADGIKKAQLTMTDSFVWLDIYFKDEASYNSLNYQFINNFVGFKFALGSKPYKQLFAVTEYKGQYMLRCKFDSYALSQLQKDTNNGKLTVKSLFSGNLLIYSTNYDKTTTLFVLK